MGLRQLGDRLFYGPHEERRDRPVLSYIRGDCYALAVDAGSSPDHVHAFYHALTARGLPLPDFTVLTHWHWDHSFELCAVHGVSIAGGATNEKLRRVAGWRWDEAAMQARLASGEDIALCDTCIRLEYPDRRAIRVIPAAMEFHSGISLDLGGLTCRIWEAKAPHSPDSVLIHVPQLETLFVGDAGGEDLYAGGGSYDGQALRAYIRTLEECPFSRCVSGHSEPCTKEEELAYLREELAKLE